MDDTVTLRDRLKMASFILTNSRLTNGPQVKYFEQQWSDWLGCDHSLFVSSGSTANSLLIAAWKEMYGIPDGAKVIVPACTWVTNIGPIIQNNLTATLILAKETGLCTQLFLSAKVKNSQFIIGSKAMMELLGTTLMLKYKTKEKRLWCENLKLL